MTAPASQVSVRPPRDATLDEPRPPFNRRAHKSSKQAATSTSAGLASMAESVSAVALALSAPMASSSDASALSKRCMDAIEAVDDDDVFTGVPQKRRFIQILQRDDRAVDAYTVMRSKKELRRNWALAELGDLPPE